MPMFTKNRELRIRAVKINPTDNLGEMDSSHIDPEQINLLAKDFVTHNGEVAQEFVTHSVAQSKSFVRYAAIAATAVIAAGVVLTTASEIIVNKTKQN